MKRSESPTRCCQVTDSEGQMMQLKVRSDELTMLFLVVVILSFVDVQMSNSLFDRLEGVSSLMLFVDIVR